MSVHPSVRPVPVPSGQKLTSILASVSQNVTNRSCLVCIKSEKYASWVTLTPQLDRYCRGKAEVRILDFKTTWSKFQMPSQTAPAEAKPRCVYLILIPQGQSYITSPRFGPKQLCALAHLGCTRAADALHNEKLVSKATLIYQYLTLKPHFSVSSSLQC